MRYYKHLLTIVVVVLFSMSVSAQSTDTIVLQIAMHEVMTTSLDVQAVFTEFEALHEGVQVQPVAFNQIVEGADTWKQYLQTGDVVYIEAGSLTPTITRTGYLLDIDPLYRIDTLVTDHPAEDSFVWGGKRWAMAAGYSPLVLSFDATRFDQLALSAPDTEWTLADLQTWANVLHDSGVETPIFVDETSLPFFLRHALGYPLYDATISPVQPTFQSANVDANVTILRDLITDGLLSFGTIYSSDREFAPITMTAYWNTNAEEAHSQIPLGMHTSGFGISAGTNYPELAYELTRFLVQHPSMTRRFGGWSIYGEDSEFASDLPFDASDGLSYQQTIFTDDLMPVIQSTETDVVSALQTAESDAQARLSAAAERQSETLVVPAAEPRIEAENIIRFAVQTNLSPLPNRNAWETLARDFAENTPDISEVLVDPIFAGDSSLETLSGLYDCFYTENNRIPNGDLSTISALSPLMDADPNFNPDDFVGTLLDSVSRDNQIWGFPMDVKPYTMWISEAFLDASGLDMTNGMTTETFSQLIGSASETPVMIPYNWGGTHALLLIYAYGGVPYDYDTTPPTIDFSAEETLFAIQHVINLIETDILDYTPFSDYSSGSGISPIIIAPMNSANVRSGNLVLMSSGMGGANSPYHPHLFPRGQTYAPISYDTGTAYISSDTDLRTPCYDFLRFVSGEPSLFGGMPARLSTIDAMQDSGMRQPESIDFYLQFANLAGRSDTLVIPSTTYRAFEEQTRQHILLKAIDLSISGDLILEDALAQAQDVATEFQACVESEDPANGMSIVLRCFDITQAWLER